MHITHKQTISHYIGAQFSLTVSHINKSAWWNQNQTMSNKNVALVSLATMQYNFL